MTALDEPDGHHETSRKLRILALNKRSWQHSRAGGSELNLEESLKGLAQRGHRVDLLVGTDEARPSPAIDEGVTIHRVGAGGDLRAPWDVVASYFFVSLYFYWYLLRLRPDVVYAVNVPLPWPVYTRRPRVTIYHHVAIDTFFQTHPFPQNLLGFIAQWLGVLRERSNPTVSVSPSTTEELVSRGHDPASVHEIRNGLDLEQYRPGTESLDPEIVYVGGLERYKGVDRLPAIHRALQDVFDGQVELHVAGRDGPVRESIEAYCAQTETAHFHGFVSEAEKVERLQRAWVFIAPSRVEGWGIAVLEANACGTPAVGSDVKGLRDSIRDGETGLLADGSDPTAFATRIETLLSDSDERERLGAEARAWAEEHSWASSVDRLETLLVSVTTGDR